MKLSSEGMRDKFPRVFSQWSGVGCVIRKPKNVSYVVESGNGERRKQKVISIFE